jgi:hypothetical protein
VSTDGHIATEPGLERDGRMPLSGRRLPPPPKALVSAAGRARAFLCAKSRTRGKGDAQSWERFAVAIHKVVSHPESNTRVVVLADLRSERFCPRNLRLRQMCYSLGVKNTAGT